jgi:hypothetical protein
MSYARLPLQRRPLYGLGSAYSDLPGAGMATLKQTAVDYGQAVKQSGTAYAQSVASAAKQQAIDYGNQLIASYPSAAEVVQQYNQYKSYLEAIPDFNVNDMKDPKKVVHLMEQALLNYAAANGILLPTSSAAVKADVEAYALAVASGYTGIDLSQYKNITGVNAKSLENAALDIACTACVMYTGIDPSLLTVTAEALADGKLTEDECKAIGTVAGAIAGAAIGQMVGIPAPIGAMIGGLAGGYVGGTIGEIFGLGGKSEAEMRAEYAAAVAEWTAFMKTANATFEAACVPIQNKYWDTFDNILLGNELRWEMAEVQIGWKFGLRWYGIEPNQPRYSQSSVRNLPVLVGFPFSHAWDAPSQSYTGPVTTANRAEVDPSIWSYQLYLDNGTATSTNTYWCAYDYGCPYPTSPNLGAGILERDAEAFAARGAIYIPPAQRTTECALPSSFPRTSAAYVQQLTFLLNAEYAALQGLSAISIAVSGDLVRTAASVAAEKALNDQLTQSASEMAMAATKRTTDLASAQVTGSNLSTFLNYSALFIGVGVLGAALYKGHRS